MPVELNGCRVKRELLFRRGAHGVFEGAAFLYFDGEASLDMGSPTDGQSDVAAPYERVVVERTDEVTESFRERRPVHDGPRPHKLRQPKTSSFPSGHASAAMVAAAMLSRQGGAPVWYLLAGIVATSRIHVRIHHGSDVVGGALLGAGLGVLARRIAATVL